MRMENVVFNDSLAWISLCRWETEAQSGETEAQSGAGGCLLQHSLQGEGMR